MATRNDIQGVGAKKVFVLIGAIAGITGCLADIVAMFFLGMQIQGYSQLKNTMSQLGIMSSPVAAEISLCWIAMGFLLIIFGISIRFSFASTNRHVIIASWLIILYGIGEGLGSGILPVDNIGARLTWMGIVHNAVGGIGVAGMALFPFIMAKVIPDLKRISIIVFFIGLAGVILFGIARFLDAPDNFVMHYKGLWQRAYVINYYVYIIVIAVKMIQDSFCPT